MSEETELEIPSDTIPGRIYLMDGDECVSVDVRQDIVKCDSDIIGVFL